MRILAIAMTLLVSLSTSATSDNIDNFSLTQPGSAIGDDSNTSDPNDLAYTEDDLNRPVFDVVFENIFVGKLCTSCHEASAGMADLALDTKEAAFKDLVSTPSFSKPGVTRVTPGDASPQKSYLMAKLVEDRSYRLGGRMPPMGYLSDPEIDLVRMWIESGADTVTTLQEAIDGRPE